MARVRSGAADKIGSLRRAGHKPLATFYRQAAAAPGYWRITLPAKYLPGRIATVRDRTHVMVRHRGNDRPLEFPQLENGTAIVQFPGDKGTALACTALEATGRRLFVEVDDNYLDAHLDPLWAERAGWGTKIGDDSYTTEGHRWISEHAHGVIVTARAIAKVYGEVNGNVHVCRNSIDPDDWPRTIRSVRDLETFRIGWYASPSHDRDAEQVRRALSWASRQPNVEVVNIGLDPDWKFSRRQIPWQSNFQKLRLELCKLDVGVCPLVGTVMTKYRSDLKALEYAMGGAMPFVQSYEPYWEWQNLEFARVAATPDEWERQIRWAVANRDEVRARAQQAREYVLEHRTFRTEIERWRQAIAGGEA